MDQTYNRFYLQKLNRITNLTFWYAFFIISPLIVVVQNISFFIFPFWMYAVYLLSRKLFSFDKIHQWLAVLFVIGAILSLIYMPSEVLSRGGIARSLQVLPNYMYWGILIIFLITQRNYIHMESIFKAAFYGLISISIYHFVIEDYVSFLPFFASTTQNSYAFITIAYTPLAVYYVFNRWGMRYAIIFTCVCVVVSFLGGSRSGSVLVLVGGSFVLIIARTNVVKVIVWVGIMCVVASYMLTTNIVKQTILSLNPRTYDLIYNTEKVLQTDRSYLVRQAMIAKGLALYDKYPYTGIGVNNFTNYEMRVKGDFAGAKFVNNKNIFEDRSAHNSYLGLLSEGGLFLLIPFVALLTLSVLHFIIRFNTIPYYHKPVFIGLICMSIHFYFIMSVVNIYAWFMIGLSAALVYRK